MNNKERLELAEWVTKKTLQNGADEATVSITNNRSVDVSFRDKKIEQLQEATENNLNINIYVNHRYSGHNTSDLRKEALEKFIEQAVAGTKYLTEDKFRNLPDKELYPTKLDVDLDLADSEYKNVDTDQRVKIASQIEDAAKSLSDKIISVTSGYSDTTYEKVLIQSNGFKGESGGTIFSAGSSVTVMDKDGGRPEDWYWATTRYYKELPSTAELGKLAAERALRKIGQKKINTGKYTMIVENRAAGRLIGMIQSAISARSIQQKSSFLDGMLDKKIASEKLTVIDDPFLKRGFGSRLFDGEGIAAKKRVVIDKGILKCYYVDNYYGKKAGLEPNSGSSSNILFEYGKRNIDEIIKDTKKGIIINSFLGGNSNSTTGDFSFGMVGLLVENGTVVQPVNEMNISGNAKEFWNQLVEVGGDAYKFSSMLIPTMVFENVNFSGL